jgi:hypothetical protein
MPLPEFRQKYVNKEGHISSEGSAYFVKKAEGLISYLNREHDPSTFAIPKYRTIHVPLGDIDIPSAQEVARECIMDIHRVSPKKKTLKQKRRICYLGSRSKFRDNYEQTQKSQMLRCFGTKAKIPEFPTYDQYLESFGDVDPEAASVSLPHESAGTAGAVWHFGTASR